MEEKLWHLEGFEEHLRCSNPVSNRVVGWLCQKHRVFTRVDLELLEDVPPNGFHVFPVLDDTVVHRVTQLEDALELFGLLADKTLRVIRCKHDTFVLGTSNAVSLRKRLVSTRVL